MTHTFWVVYTLERSKGVQTLSKNPFLYLSTLENGHFQQKLEIHFCAIIILLRTKWESKRKLTEQVTNNKGNLAIQARQFGVPTLVNPLLCKFLDFGTSGNTDTLRPESFLLCKYWTEWKHNRYGYNSLIHMHRHKTDWHDYTSPTGPTISGTTIFLNYLRTWDIYSLTLTWVQRVSFLC